MTSSMHRILIYSKKMCAHECTRLIQYLIVFLAHILSSSEVPPSLPSLPYPPTIGPLLFFPSACAVHTPCLSPSTCRKHVPASRTGESGHKPNIHPAFGRLVVRRDPIYSLPKAGWSYAVTQPAEGRLVVCRVPSAAAELSLNVSGGGNLNLNEDVELS